MAKESRAVIVGQVIAAAREKAGLTQEKLAEAARMDRSHLADIERGVSSVSLDKFLSICAALRTPAATIVQEIEKRIGVSAR